MSEKTEPKSTPPVNAAQTSERMLDSVIISNGDPVASEKRKLIAIHGLGDTPENFSALFRDDLSNSAIILPRAPSPHGSGGSWFPVSIPVKTTPINKLKTDVKNAAEALCETIRSFRFKRRPVVTGFSQGGILSYTIAVTCPSQISAAVPVAGFLPVDIPPDKQIPPVIAFHGEADPIIDFAWGVESVQRLKKENVSAEMHSYKDTGHTISGQMYKEWMAVLNERLQNHLLK